MGMIPDRHKNFNKIVLAGAFLFALAQLITGPVMGIPVPDPSSKASFLWTASGLAIGGIAGSLVMPYGMPALG